MKSTYVFILHPNKTLFFFLKMWLINLKHIKLPLEKNAKGLAEAHSWRYLQILHCMYLLNILGVEGIRLHADGFVLFSLQKEK